MKDEKGSNVQNEGAQHLQPILQTSADLQTHNHETQQVRCEQSRRLRPSHSCGVRSEAGTSRDDCSNVAAHQNSFYRNEAKSVL